MRYSRGTAAVDYFNISKGDWVMAEKDLQLMDVYLDLLPNQPKNDDTREWLAKRLRDLSESRVSDAVERMWELPPIVLTPPSGEHVSLLLEARELFLWGHFYSCVAMCGVVG